MVRLVAGFVLSLIGRSGDVLFGFFHGSLEILFGHFDFLLNHIELRLDGFSKIFGSIFESFERLADLTSYFWQLFWPEQKKCDHENDEYFACSQSKHRVQSVCALDVGDVLCPNRHATYGALPLFNVPGWCSLCG